VRSFRWTCSVRKKGRDENRPENRSRPGPWSTAAMTISDDGARSQMIRCAGRPGHQNNGPDSSDSGVFARSDGGFFFAAAKISNRARLVSLSYFALSHNRISVAYGSLTRRLFVSDISFQLRYSSPEHCHAVHTVTLSCVAGSDPPPSMGLNW